MLDFLRKLTQPVDADERERTADREMRDTLERMYQDTRHLRNIPRPSAPAAPDKSPEG